jgi:hypothetical protein
MLNVSLSPYRCEGVAGNNEFKGRIHVAGFLLSIGAEH